MKTSTTNKFVLLFLSIVFFSLVLFVEPAYAQCSGGSGGGGANTLQNPTCFSNIQRFIEGVLRAVVYIAMPIIALFMVYAGFLFVKARGNDAELSTAKKNFVYVVIGAILILGAWVFATIIGGTVSQIIGK